MSEDLHEVPASAWVPRTMFVRPLPAKDAVIDPVSSTGSKDRWLMCRSP
ncbi:MAG: hypothetical protein LC733_13705 [Actinobacteria bacterium]|nr:hypothetical protein [Actinomycetota bacterium]